MIRALLEITFNTSSKDLCEAILWALLPDDKTPPRGFTINTYCKEDILIYEAQSKDLQLLTLASIIDEISRLCEMVEKTVRCLKTLTSK